MPDRDFYVRRAKQERELSLAANNPAAAEVHRQLEEAYRAKLDGSATATTPSASVVKAINRVRGDGLWFSAAE